APEQRVAGNADRDIEIARGRSPLTRVASARQPDALAVGNTRRNPDQHGLGPRLLAAARADVASARPLLPRAGTGGATPGKHHVAAHRAQHAGPLAHRTRPW